MEFVNASRRWVDQDQGGRCVEESHGDGLPLRDAAAPEPNQLLVAPDPENDPPVRDGVVATVYLTLLLTDSATNPAAR